MTRTLQVDPRALAEADSIARWYEEHRPGHGWRFRHEIDHVFARITEHPEGYQMLADRFRRAFTRRFPFVVIYRVTTDQIQVIGVMPTRADPTIVSLLMDTRAD